MEEIKLPVAVIANPNVITQEVEDEVVLLHMGTEEYFSLDDVGTVMWKLLCENTSVEATLTALVNTYEVDETRLRHDLAILIEKLVAHKLVTTQDY